MQETKEALEGWYIDEWTSLAEEWIKTKLQEESQRRDRKEEWVKPRTITAEGEAETSSRTEIKMIGQALTMKTIKIERSDEYLCWI